MGLAVGIGVAVAVIAVVASAKDDVPRPPSDPGSPKTREDCIAVWADAMARQADSETDPAVLRELEAFASAEGWGSDVTSCLRLKRLSIERGEGSGPSCYEPLYAALYRDFLATDSLWGVPITTATAAELAQIAADARASGFENVGRCFEALAGVAPGAQPGSAGNGHRPAPPGRPGPPAPPRTQPTVPPPHGPPAPQGGGWLPTMPHLPGW